MSTKVAGWSGFARRMQTGKRLRLALGLGILSTGCAAMSPNYSLTKSAASTSPKAATCDFTVMTVPTDRAQEQVGILDAELVPYAATTAAEFQEAVRKQVCEVGGDAVLAEINGHGRYVRGTIVRWKDG